MQWDLLINDKRFGLENYRGRRRESRSDFQRDFDRLVFSSPFRRLQNKTQVFPLPGSIFVHNRLTHSLEVSCVGRSMAREVSHRLREKYAGEPWDVLVVLLHMVFFLFLGRRILLVLVVRILACLFLFLP